jgi:hypothetical protein
MFTNYISSKVKFEDLGDSKLKINGKIYTYDDTLDPEYQDDGVLDISYYTLEDEDGEPTNMVYAFDAKDCENPQEWCDQYDADNPYVLEFN